MRESSRISARRLHGHGGLRTGLHLHRHRGLVRRRGQNGAAEAALRQVGRTGTPLVVLEQNNSCLSNPGFCGQKNERFETSSCETTRRELSSFSQMTMGAAKMALESGKYFNMRVMRYWMVYHYQTLSLRRRKAHGPTQGRRHFAVGHDNSRYSGTVYQIGSIADNLHRVSFSMLE